MSGRGRPPGWGPGAPVHGGAQCHCHRVVTRLVTPYTCGVASETPPSAADREAPAARPGISLVFPAFNEELNLEPVVSEALRLLPGLADPFEVIVVNDGSADGTGPLAERLALDAPGLVSVVHHPRNRGYGAALKSGIERAKHALIFFCDSDGQFTLEDLPVLLAWIDRYDMVIGYRQQRQDPAHRRLNAWGWNTLTRLVFGLRVRDIDCAFKLFRREVFDNIRIDTVGAMVNTEILVRALREGFTVKEVPVRHFPRYFGTPTGANPRVVLKAFRELWKIYRKVH